MKVWHIIEILEYVKLLNGFLSNKERNTAIKKSILYVLIVCAIAYLSFTVFKPSKTGGRIDYKSAIKLDIPPDYTNLSGIFNSGYVDVKQVAGLFLKNLGAAGVTKIGVKFNSEGQEIIYLLDTEDNTIRKREINISGTLMEYTWRGAYKERLEYAAENNRFNPPGFSAGEVKNLYHWFLNYSLPRKIY